MRPKTLANPSTAVWHRLHPAMLLFQLAGILRRYFLLFVVGGVASSRGENFVNFIFLSSSLALAVGLIRYSSYRYSVGEKYLTVTEGVFTKKTHRYLLDKINHVNRHQNPLAKLMGIVRLELQQEASNIPALIFPAVTFKQAKEIEEAIQSHSSYIEKSADAKESDRQVLYQSTLMKSLIEGLSSLPVRIFFVVGILYRFYGRAITPYIIDEYELYVKTLANFGIESDNQFWLFVITSIVLVYLAALLIGVATALVRWFRYRVVVKSQLIFIVSGLFTRSTRVINPQQIQAIVGIANPIRRLFDLCQWQIVAPRPGRHRGRASQLVPIGKSAEISRLLPSIWSVCNYPDKNWLPVESYHRRRLWLLSFVSLFIGVSLISGIDAYFSPLARGGLWQRALDASLPAHIGLGVIALLLLVLLHRMVRINYADTAYRLDESFLCIKSAFLAQRTYIVPLEKIQAVIFSRSIMQLRRGLVTVELDINGILRPVRLYNVTDKVAEQLRATVVHKVNAHNI